MCDSAPSMNRGSGARLCNIPPDFFAPSLFPAPSFAPLARPCAKLVELRMAVVGLTEFCDNRKFERAASRFDKQGCLPRGNALIRGSSMFVVLACVYVVLKCCHNFPVETQTPKYVALVPRFIRG